MPKQEQCSQRERGKKVIQSNLTGNIINVPKDYWTYDVCQEEGLYLWKTLNMVFLIKDRGEYIKPEFIVYAAYSLLGLTS